MKLINNSERIITVGRVAVPPHETRTIVAQYAATDEVKAAVSLGLCELVYEDGDEAIVNSAEAAKLTTYDINQIYAPGSCCGGSSSSGSSSGTTTAEQQAVDNAQNAKISSLETQLASAIKTISELQNSSSSVTLVDVSTTTEAQNKDSDGNYDMDLYSTSGYYNFTNVDSSIIKNSTGTINGKLLVNVVDGIVYQTFTDTDGVEYGRTYKNGTWGEWVGYVDEHSVEDNVLIL